MRKFEAMRKDSSEIHLGIGRVMASAGAIRTRVGREQLAAPVGKERTTYHQIYPACCPLHVAMEQPREYKRSSRYNGVEERKVDDFELRQP